MVFADHKDKFGVVKKKYKSQNQWNHHNNSNWNKKLQVFNPTETTTTSTSLLTYATATSTIATPTSKQSFHWKLNFKGNLLQPVVLIH